MRSKIICHISKLLDLFYIHIFEYTKLVAVELSVMTSVQMTDEPFQYKCILYPNSIATVVKYSSTFYVCSRKLYIVYVRILYLFRYILSGWGEYGNKNTILQSDS